MLPLAEFAYNDSVNRSTGWSPFEIVTGYHPRRPMDLIPLPTESRPSEHTESFAHFIHDLHAEICRKINLSNMQYKTSADIHRRFQEFSEGDMVMVRVRPERFPRGGQRKLLPRSTGPYRVVRRVGSNAYVLDLPSDLGINPVFNVEDLVPYREHEEPVQLASHSLATT